MTEEELSSKNVHMHGMPYFSITISFADSKIKTEIHNVDDNFESSYLYLPEITATPEEYVAFKGAIDQELWDGIAYQIVADSTERGLHRVYELLCGYVDSTPESLKRLALQRLIEMYAWSLAWGPAKPIHKLPRSPILTVNDLRVALRGGKE